LLQIALFCFNAPKDGPISVRPMSINPKSWAEAFTEELTVAGEHVPLDRLVARHREAFIELRRLGMTWRGISSLLVRAGARRADGGLISSDQIRVSYSRQSRKDIPARRTPARTAKPQPARIAIDAPPLAAAAPPGRQRIQSTDPEERPTDPQDVSGTEIEAALSRLGKIGPTGVKE